MKTTLYAMALAATLSTMAIAADWSGKLVDAECNNQKEASKQADKSQSCNATTATTSFAIDVAGKLYRLDPAGNAKATAALRKRADTSSDPAKALTAVYSAKIVGAEKEGVITVESLEVP